MLSVVIPTIGRPSELFKCITELYSSASHLIHEVIVVLDGVDQHDLDPGTPMDVRFVRVEKAGAASARNTGALIASGKYLAFMDDDIVIGPRWAASVAAAVSSNLSIFTGPVLPLDSTVISRARDVRYRRRYHGLSCRSPVSFFAGGNGIVNRELFLSLGGFPLSNVGSDNLLVRDLINSADSCKFCWGMAVYHRNDRGILTAIRAAWRSGRSDAKVGQRLERPALNAPFAMFEIGPAIINIVLYGCKTTGWVIEGFVKVRQ